MKNTILNLQNAVIKVFDNEDNPLSQGIIIEFPTKEDSKRVRPYFVFPLISIDSVESGYILFKLDNGDVHKAVFDRTFITKFFVDGFVIYPIANLLNTFVGKKINVYYSGIPSTISINEKTMEFMNPIEELTIYSWNKKLTDIVDTPCIYVSRNITPIYGLNSSKKSVIISSIDCIENGAPVFLINNGGYFANNTIYMGSRIVFIGIIEKNENNLFFVKRSDDLCSLIHSKYERIYDNLIKQKDDKDT